MARKAKRKENKARPYRVDFINAVEVQYGKAQVHSAIVRAVTAGEAKEGMVTVKEHMAGVHYIPIKAYRFYKKLPQESSDFVAIAALFPGKRAAAVTAEVQTVQQGARTEQDTPTPAAHDIAATQDRMVREGISTTDWHSLGHPVPQDRDLLDRSPRHEDDLDTDDAALQQDADWYKKNDRTISMMQVSSGGATLGVASKFTPKLPEPCPCGKGIDTDGDGNCPACAGGALQQSPEPQSYTFYWAVAVTSLVLAALYAVFYYVWPK
jgi:hypothetical protein